MSAMTADPSLLLYIDTSAFLDQVFGHGQHVAVTKRLAEWLDAGGAVVSSRLLWLESSRVAVREALLGNGAGDAITVATGSVTQLPMPEIIWQEAAAIPLHVRSLDALHLATCRFVQATLLTSDRRQAEAAEALGIPCAIGAVEL